MLKGVVILHCRYCGHRWYETELAVDLMKYHPTCVKCFKPVEIMPFACG